VTLTVTNRNTQQTDTMTTNVLISEEGEGAEKDPNQSGDPGLRRNPTAQVSNALIACQSAADTGFSSLKVTRAGKGLKFEGTARGGNGAFLTEIYQVAKGRSASKPKKVASFTVTGSYTWNGKPKKGKLSAGTYYAQMSARGTGAREDVRAVGLTRSKTAFKLRKPFQRPDTCSEISLFRLDSPAFGPKRKLTASFTLTQPGTATIEVRRGKKRVARITRKAPTANRLQKVAISPKKLRKGEYKIILRAGGKTETLNARRY
jgi:hypothetical protein